MSAALLTTKKAQGTVSRSKRSLVSGFALACVLLVAIPVSTSAATLPDQSNPGPAANGVLLSGNDRVAQIFRAGITGQLTKITLWGCNEQDVLTSVRIEVYQALPSPPSATPPVLPSTILGEATVSDIALIPDNSNCTLPIPSFDVSLDTPAPIVAGNLYAFVVSATKSPATGGLRLRGSAITTYPDGNRADSADSGGTWTARTDRNLLFTTYVNVPDAVPEAQRFELTLTPSDGARCTNSSQTETAGTWVVLPGANDCTPPAAKANAKLLGWATNPNFPVEIAQRQVDNGWGAYETFNADGQLTGVFIPAGGATFLSAAGKLYSIWSE